MSVVAALRASATTIVVMSAQPLVRVGLCHLLGGGAVVVGACSTVRDAWVEVVRTRPRVAVLDGPVAALGRLRPADVARMRQLGARVVVLVPDPVDRVGAAAFLAAGAAVVLGRDATPRLVLDAVLAASSGADVEGSAVAAHDAPWASLTPRERDVLRLVGDGASNAAAAAALGVAASTVKFHLRGLTRKLGARNRIELAGLALRLGV